MPECYVIADSRSFLQRSDPNGIRPNLNFSRLCAIASQTCARLRVREENANQGICTIRAELRSSSVRLCPTIFFCPQQPHATVSLAGREGRSHVRETSNRNRRRAGARNQQEAAQILPTSLTLPLSWQIGFAGIDRGGNDSIPPPSK
jgi:hypothetical protein